MDAVAWDDATFGSRMTPAKNPAVTTKEATKERYEGHCCDGTMSAGRYPMND
jgi:hypothetical protein